MSTWTKQKLSDICDVRDGTHDSPKPATSGFPLVTSKHIINNKIDFSSAYLITNEDFDAVNKRSKVSKFDILISMIGTVGEIALVKEEPRFAIKNVGLIKTNNETLGKYLFYYLISPTGKNILSSFLTGSTQKFISLSKLRDFPITLPPEENQNKITSVLSAYDDLIENNEKRIKILEEMAQLLYTEWFVKFKFPGYEKVKVVHSGTEYGKIPTGWEVRNVESLIKRIPVGKKYENKSVLEIGRVPVLDQGKSGFIGYHNDEPGVKASIENPVIVFANHTCYQNIIVYPFSAIQNVLPFVPNDERDIFWLHWSTKDLIKFNDYKGHWPEYMSKKLIVPSVDLTKKFGSIVGKYVAMKYKMETENKNLSQIRDLLIPQLVNGKRDLK